MIKLIKKFFFGIDFNKYNVGFYLVTFKERKYSTSIRRDELCYLCNTFVDHTIGSIFITDETPTSDIEKPFCRNCSYKYNLDTRNKKKQRVAIALLKMKGIL